MRVPAVKENAGSAHGRAAHGRFAMGAHQCQVQQCLCELLPAFGSDAAELLPILTRMAPHYRHLRSDEFPALAARLVASLVGTQGAMMPPASALGMQPA